MSTLQSDSSLVFLQCFKINLTAHAS